MFLRSLSFYFFWRSSLALFISMLPNLKKIWFYKGAKHSIWPIVCRHLTVTSHPYVDFPQTFGMTVEAQKHLGCLHVLYHYDFQSVDLRGANMFQHDNASVLRARFVRSQFAKVGGEELECSAQSPDSNPSEHLWDELERQQHPMSPRATSVPDLTVADWPHIPTAPPPSSCERLSQKSGGNYQEQTGTRSRSGP